MADNTIELLRNPRSCFEAVFCSDKSEHISALPDSAFAFVEKGNKAGRFFPHHTKDVEKPSQNSTIDSALLLASLNRLQESPFSAKTKRRIYKHLLNHFKYMRNNSHEYHDMDELEFAFGELDDDCFEDYEYKPVRVGPEKIFRVGTWNGQEFNAKRIQTMVNSFNQLKDSFLPAIKCSHEQNKKPNQYDERAVGYMNDIATDGEFITAMFEYDPFFFEYEIKQMRFRWKSIEVWHNYTQNGEVFEDLISAVALLGVSPPAVLGLGELKREESEYSSKKESEIYYFDSEENTILNSGKEKEMTDVKKDNEIEVVTPEVKDEQVEVPAVEPEVAPEVKDEPKDTIEISSADFSSLSNRMKALEAAASENANLKAELGEARAALDLMYKASKKQEYEYYTEDLVRSGKLTPAQKEMVVALFEAIEDANTVMKFGADQKEISAMNLFKEFLDNFKAWPVAEAPAEKDNSKLLSDALPTSEEKPIMGNHKGVQVPVDGVEVDKKAKEYAAKHNCSYVDALVAVTKN